MTTIAYRDGVLAADSCETTENDSAGTTKNLCQKLFRIGHYAIALQGESSPGMVWLRWFTGEHAKVLFERGARPLQSVPDALVDRFLDAEADFTAVVLDPDGKLFEYDAWGIPMPVHAPYYAVGSGSKAALGAMANGAGAVAAVEAACVHDPYSCLPVHSEAI